MSVGDFYLISSGSLGASSGVEVKCSPASFFVDSVSSGFGRVSTILYYPYSPWDLASDPFACVFGSSLYGPCLIILASVSYFLLRADLSGGLLCVLSVMSSSFVSV